MIFFLVVFFIGVPAGLLDRDATTKECECGIEMGSSGNESTRRIINGKEVRPHSFPWVVYIIGCLDLIRCSLCGGAIINNLYILTAGHCVENKIALTVVAGAHKIHEEGLKLKVQSAILHPKFYRNSGKPGNDIALIKLREPIQYSNKIKPICLPKGYKSYAYSNALVAGWGRTEGGKHPGKMIHTRLQITTDEICGREWDLLVSENICAYNFNTSTCKGDSGGALFSAIAPYTHEVIGLVSFGHPQCDPITALSVYTRVTTYLKWIYNNTKDAYYCHNPTDNYDRKTQN